MLSKADFLFDKRLAERFIRRGEITREQYEAHLRELADATEKSQPMAQPGEATEDSEDEE